MDSRILIGDARERLAELPACSIQCAVTSPPYFRLRSYLADDHPDKAKEIGSEQSIEEFIAALLDVFEAVRRVLRDDGTLFVNIGDSYADDKKWGGSTGGIHAGGLHGQPVGRGKVKTGLKSGDLMLIPFRFAIAMVDAGWYLRSKITWRKLSPMPEMVSGWRWVRCRKKISKQLHAADEKQRFPHSGDLRYVANGRQAKYSPCPGCKKCEPNEGYVLRKGRWRPTSAEEPIFMFTKSETYFCDGDAVAEAVSGGAHSRGSGFNPKAADGVAGREKQNGGFSVAVRDLVHTRNPRSVMIFPSEPLKEKHFATYPSSLPAFAIRAATSAVGCCPTCGTCYAPIVESERIPTRPALNNKGFKYSSADATSQRTETSPNLDPERHIAVKTVLGHRPGCNCRPILPPVPCTVADPFFGWGRTGQAANALGRNWIGCELNPEYAAGAAEHVKIVPKWALPAKPKRRAAVVPLPEQLQFTFYAGEEMNQAESP